MKDAAALHVKELFEAMQTTSHGLSSEEAGKRLSKYGPNKLVEKKHLPVAYRFLRNLKDLFSVLLLFASLLAAFGGMFVKYWACFLMLSL